MRSTEVQPRPPLGPWRVASFGLYGFELVGPKGEKLGCINGSDGADDPEFYPAKANARLIAAAPDLLVAAKAALNDRMYKHWPGIADLLIAAIAKAEGRP